MSREQPDVIVVGAGFMGATSAFFLRRRGLKVLLLERGQVGQHASGTNFGNVRRQGRILAQIPLANRSRALWGRLPELIAEDLEFIPTGHIRVCYREEELLQLQAYNSSPELVELGLTIYQGAEMRKRFPYLGPTVLAVSHAPFDGHANPRLAAPAFARAAVRAGAMVREGVEISRVEKSGTLFTITSTEGEVFTAPKVLITAGGWGSKLSSQFGEPVPIVLKGPQMAVTEPLPYCFKEVVGVYSKTKSEIIYFRQVARGNVVFGGGFHTQLPADALLSAHTAEALAGQTQRLRQVAPALGRINVIRTWSGVEGYTADDRPVISASSQVEGLYYAFAFCGHGFQLGPGVGDVMAELIATGASSTPIDAFDIARFAAPTPPGLEQKRHTLTS